MKVLGLTGGIGSGKTTVANFFRELGVPVYIADDEAKELMNSDPGVKKAITEIFGENSYTSNGLDRKYLADRVFKSKELLEKLNAIVHPAVNRHFEEWKSKQQSAYVVYEAAILFEKGGSEKCDFTLLITAPHEVKIERLLQRDNSSLEEIEARMENQWSDEKKAALANFIIENNDLSRTRQEVRNIHLIMLQSA
ncbi:dephospho-CoA kinase [Salinimicrobium flavum]|uniref:Dephospho-CoA kinase n=1 Tax=Salinimicrobium flavum TaxID=1737065 RepID=A0ABW5IZJ7_9FLAO